MVSRFLEWWHAHTRFQLALALGFVVWILFVYAIILILSR